MSFKPRNIFFTFIGCDLVRVRNILLKRPLPLIRSAGDSPLFFSTSDVFNYHSTHMHIQPPPPPPPPQPPPPPPPPLPINKLHDDGHQDGELPLKVHFVNVILNYFLDLLSIFFVFVTNFLTFIYV